MKLAEHMSRIGVETAFEVLVRARELEAAGRSVIHLEIGEPDFDTPRHIVDAAKQALGESHLRFRLRQLVREPDGGGGADWAIHRAMKSTSGGIGGIRAARPRLVVLVECE